MKYSKSVVMERMIKYLEQSKL